MALNVDSLVAALQSASFNTSGVSFAGKSLKLDTEADAKPVIEAIEQCKELNFLNLEGNTLGVDASKGIAQALEKHPEFKRALWKDMFTGRMKTEIPKALQFLGNGLVTAGARLTELDLSDNAFGPIGVEGLASLLRSSSCYALEELRLNNNGLGIGGGKLLAGALLDCYKCSKQQGKPLALKVFIAGRNRLENDGAKALAEVFKTIGTLEEIAMPQNGIYHVGISALFDAFKHNPNLQVLNLNDNTIGPKGAKAISGALPKLGKLREINFGDCLLKTKGAKILADGLLNCSMLEDLILGSNEIKTEGAIELIKAMSNKSKLKTLYLDGNTFGERGISEIRAKLKNIGKLNTLGELDEDEPCDSDDEEDDDDEESTDEEQNEEEAEEEETEPSKLNVTVEEIKTAVVSCTVEEFISYPTSDKFLGLGDNKADLLLNEAKKNLDKCIDTSVTILMKIAALSASPDKEVAESSLKCCELLYRELFTWANKNEKISILNNVLLVNLGLIKSEDKKYKPSWNVDGCLYALETIIKKNYIPDSTRDTFKVFVKMNIDKSSGDTSNAKKKLLATLS